VKLENVGHLPSGRAFAGRFPLRKRAGEFQQPLNPWMEILVKKLKNEKSKKGMRLPLQNADKQGL